MPNFCKHDANGTKTTNRIILSQSKGWSGYQSFITFLSHYNNRATAGLGFGITVRALLVLFFKEKKTSVLNINFSSIFNQNKGKAFFVRLFTDHYLKNCNRGHLGGFSV